MYFYKEDKQYIYISNYKEIGIIEKRECNFDEIKKSINWVDESLLELKDNKTAIIKVVDCDFSLDKLIKKAEIFKCDYYVFDFFDICILILSSNIDKINYIIEWYKKSQTAYLPKNFNLIEGKIIYQDRKLSTIIRKMQNKVTKDTIIYFDKFENIIVKNYIDACKVSRDFTNEKLALIHMENQEKKRCSQEKYSIKNLLVGRFSPIVTMNKKRNCDNNVIKIYESISNGGNGIYFDYQSGKGITNKKAFGSVVGESMERFYAMKFKDDKRIHLSYIELKQKYPSIDIVVENNNCEWERAVREWLFATNLKNNNLCLVEAPRIYFPSEILTSSTTGLGAGNTLEQAIESALLEIIERDAYAITYRANKKTMNIPWEKISRKNKILIKNLERSHLKCHLALLQSDIHVYIVHCTLENEKKSYPIYSHGSCANFKLNDAIEGAISECLQLRDSQIELKKIDELSLNENKAYAEWGRGNIEYFNIFLADNCVLEFPETIKFSNNIFELIDEINDDIVCVRLTPAHSKIEVVKVIIPTFQDIDNNMKNISERLKNELGEQIMNRRMLFT